MVIAAWTDIVMALSTDTVSAADPSLRAARRSAPLRTANTPCAHGADSNFAISRDQYVCKALRALFHSRGAPRAIRSDNGPEFVARAVIDMLHDLRIDALFIAPGARWQTGVAETFNARLRDELLDRGLFGSPREARVVLNGYRRRYNQERPHSALGYLTLEEYARQLGAAAPAPHHPNAGFSLRTDA